MASFPLNASAITPHDIDLSSDLTFHNQGLLCSRMEPNSRRVHRMSQGPASQETPYVPYQNPHRAQSPYSRSVSSFGVLTPPLRPSSPSRHHRRTHSAPRPVKETLNAEFQEDHGVRRVNNYILKREIGRGSFGVVHLGIDSNTGEEFAIKEFSKSKLRKRSQSMILRRTHHPGAANPGQRPLPSKRRSASDVYKEAELADSLYLVRGEIAIMKKLNHENVVKLIEVLDDPKGDSLYMVIEYCKKGPVMDIGLDSKVKPYPAEQARNLFRDLLLGIEYRIPQVTKVNEVHAQGIVHRDIKPDNLLLNAEDVLKIVDFGVSEMFTKDDDRLKSSNGSPAFASPELSQAGLSNVSGKAADIWAMGVTLYALIYGVLPFNNHNVLELYENIREHEVYIPENEDPNLVDLFHRILDKNPATRIKMPELREHPWVTANGEDPLLSAEENTAEMITHVTEKDYAEAIRGIRSVMHVVRAVNKLKSLRHSKGLKPGTSENSQPSSHRHTKSLDIDGAYQPIRDFFHDNLGINLPTTLSPDSTEPPPEPPLTPEIKVHEPPDEEEIQYIGVGLGSVSKADKKPRAQTLDDKASSNEQTLLQHRKSDESMRSDTSMTSGQLTPCEPMVYISPTVTHENMFEQAFVREEERIRQTLGPDAMIYSTWRSEELKGEPISNEFGRHKVELERSQDSEDAAPRWEKILKEKFPERLATLYQRHEDRLHFLQGLSAHKLLREHAQHMQIDDESHQPVHLTQDITGDDSGTSGKSNTKSHKRLDALRSVMDRLKSGASGATHDTPPTNSEQS